MAAIQLAVDFNDTPGPAAIAAAITVVDFHHPIMMMNTKAIDVSGSADPHPAAWENKQAVYLEL